MRRYNELNKAEKVAADNCIDWANNNIQNYDYPEGMKIPNELVASELYWGIDLIDSDEIDATNIETGEKYSWEYFRD